MYVNINNINWNIVRVNPLNENLFNNDGTLTIGMTDTNLKTIFINNKLKGQLLRKVLIHELVHAWIFSYGYILTNIEQEFICNFIANNSDDILNEADRTISNICFRVAL